MNDGKYNVADNISAKGSIREMGLNYGRAKFNDGTMSLRSAKKSHDGRSDKKSELKSQKDGTLINDDDSFCHEKLGEALSFQAIVKTLASNTEFLMLMLSQTGFYYVVAGIQYWCPNYLELILKVDVT